jgi:hypothetical protein
LPQNLGEIYSDKSLRLVGYAKVNLSNANQVDTFGVKLICSPIGGGSEAITNVPDGSYTLSGEGSSLWVRISRNSTNTYTPVAYAAGAAPKPSRDYIQIVYQHSLGMMTYGNQYILQSATYTNIGAGIGQKTFDAIVSSDPTGNYTSLWTAISDLASLPGARILVRNDQTISSGTTISNSYLYIEFGEGVKLTSSVLAGTSLTFSGTGTCTNNLTLLSTNPGVSGVSFTGTQQKHINMTVTLVSSCPTVFSFGAASGNNALDGKIILSGGSYTTSVSDSSTLKTNIYSFSTPLDIQMNAPGAVPIGGMVAVMPTMDAVNAWQPAASGSIKDGFMRADGSQINAGHIALGCKIALNTFLPNMVAKFAKGNATSGGTGGQSSYSLTAGQIPLLGSTSTSINHRHTTSDGPGNHGHNLWSDAPRGGFGVPCRIAHAPDIYSGATDTGTLYTHVSRGGYNFGCALENGGWNCAIYTNGTGAHNHTTDYTDYSHGHNVGQNTPDQVNNQPAYVEVVWVIRVK